MKRTSLLTLLVLCCCRVFGASDTTRVFFIGNSFTFTGDVPGLVKGMADSAKLNFEYQQHTPGGISVGDISQDTLAHWRNSQVFNSLRAGNWDYVVLQDNQGRFVLNYGTFPSPSTSRVIEGHIKIRDSMKYYNACSHMLLFSGWAVQGALPPYGSSGSVLIDRINANYSFLNDSMHEVVSPIGIAWKRSMAAMPTVNLWSPDSTHESNEGAYLTAAVIFSSVFRVNPSANTFHGLIDTSVARQMRQIAWQTVMDSMSTNNLNSIVLPVSISGSAITIASGYRGYQWYMNDTLIAGATMATLVTDTIHRFYATALDTDGCTVRSLTYTKLRPTTNVPSVLGSLSGSIHPNPATDAVEITIPSMGGIVAITDIAGKTVLTDVITSPSAQINIAHLLPGLYIVTVTSESGVYRERLLKVNR